jgi:hypothetical protein
MVQVIAVHLDGGAAHQHISSIRWLNPHTGVQGDSSRQTMVEWLRTQGNRAYVTDGYRVVEVRVVNGSPPYLRTYADGAWTDNLLALPKF